MAKVELIFEHIFKWEGIYSNDKADKGGETVKGITYTLYKSVCKKLFNKEPNHTNFINLTTEDVKLIITIFWNDWKADQITNQSIANMLVDWHFNAGTWGIKLPQTILKLKADGIVGPNTINTINEFTNQEDLFNKFKQRRIEFYKNIVIKNPIQKVFLNGWINRVNDIKFINQ